MSASVLVITAPGEAEQLATALSNRRLTAGVRLAVLRPARAPETPAGQLRKHQPDLLFLGTPRDNTALVANAIDTAAYLQVAREQHPACMVYLICDSAAVDVVLRLHPDGLLVRPLSVPKLLGTVAETLEIELPGVDPEADAPSRISTPLGPFRLSR